MAVMVDKIKKCYKLCSVMYSLCIVLYNFVMDKQDTKILAKALLAKASNEQDEQQQQS